MSKKKTLPKTKSKKEKKVTIPPKYLYLTQGIFVLLALVIFYIYGKYYNGFINLWNDLKSATSVLKYVLIFFIIFLLILLLINFYNKRKQNDRELERIANNDLKNDQDYQEDLKNLNSTSNGLKYLVWFVIFIFGLLVFCSLIKFLLPLLVIYLILFIIYLIVIKILALKIGQKGIVKDN